MLYQITSSYFCAGIGIHGNKVVYAAPILKWTIGKTLLYIVNYSKKKGWKIMAINANDAPGGKGNYKLIPIGTYKGRLVQLIDLGMQPQKFREQDKEPRRMIMLTYEFSDEFLTDEDGQELLDKPLWKSESMALYNLTAEKAKSTNRYKVLDPSNKYAGDFTKLLGAPCMITIIHNPSRKNPEQVFDNIDAISPVREKDLRNLPKLVHEPKIFDLEVPDMEMFSTFPKWVQDKIVNNLQFKGSMLEKMLEQPGMPPVEDADAKEMETDDENPY